MSINNRIRNRALHFRRFVYQVYRIIGYIIYSIRVSIIIIMGVSLLARRVLSMVTQKLVQYRRVPSERWLIESHPVQNKRNEFRIAEFTHGHTSEFFSWQQLVIPRRGENARPVAVGFRLISMAGPDCAALSNFSYIHPKQTQ